jgi:hypothetical protein
VSRVALGMEDARIGSQVRSHPQLPSRVAFENRPRRPDDATKGSLTRCKIPTDRT